MESMDFFVVCSLLKHTQKVLHIFQVFLLSTYLSTYLLVYLLYSLINGK